LSGLGARGVSPTVGYMLTAIVCAAGLAFAGLEDTLQNLVIGVLGACIFELIRPAVAHWPYVKLFLAANRPSRRNAYVRVSISYLYRIRIGSEYLLIRSSRIPDQFQPVGGVFKRLPEALTRLNELGVLDDHAMPIDSSSEYDLRVRVRGKNLVDLLRWYESGEGRETETWREFYEEMLRPGVVPLEVFPYLLTRYIGRYSTGIRWSDHFQCLEYLLAEIVEPELTGPQRQCLETIKGQQTANLLWASEPLIRAAGYELSRQQRVANVAPTAAWLFESK
jgi:SMODS-associated NUDIX domain